MPLCRLLLKNPRIPFQQSKFANYFHWSNCKYLSTEFQHRKQFDIKRQLMTGETMDALLKEQKAKIKALRANGAAEEELNREIQVMKEIQMKVKSMDVGGDTAKKFLVKTPKGTIDYTPADMAIREKIFSTITRIYRAHGAVTIDTPVFELKEILQGKYGEDSKLIYDLEDQGGEKCSLRYDLTVPFARYLALNTDCKTPIKRFHIGKVYRRDQPVMTKGRMREFFQCDYDIAGTHDPMIPDAEVVRVMCEVLRALEVGPFKVKINHRKILDGMFEACGVPESKFRTICSAVDKLDKLPWEEVKKEMVAEKGLPEEVADRIGEYVKLSGGADLIAKLIQDQRLSKNPRSSEGLAQMQLLFQFLDIFNVNSDVSFDLSLARGLDYYTGVIYEAILLQTEKAEKKKDGETVGVGSVAGGGRYDDLVGMFSSKHTKIPCVGFSIGVERIFSILKQKAAKAGKPPRHIATEVFVASIDGQLEERMRICAELWDAGLKADFAYKTKPKLQRQFEYCDKEENQIPIMVILGGDEVKQGLVRIKDQRIQSDDPDVKMGKLVKRTEMVNEIKKLLSQGNL